MKLEDLKEEDFFKSHNGKLWSKGIELAMTAPFPAVAMMHILKRVDEISRTKALQEALGLAKEHAHSIKKADKTPRYSYSKSSNARNANGELPDGGRWKNCNELADDLVSNIESLIPKNEV